MIREAIGTEAGKRWAVFVETPFGCLARLFMGRMFHGGADSDGDAMDLGAGVLISMLALPGTLVALLMFEKYGSLGRFLRGEKPLNPFIAGVPDEYLFIAISIAVSGAVALWRWDSIFLDRRDYMTLVPLPISLRQIFLANLAAVLSLTAVCTLVVNAGSLFLFPEAAAGSQTGEVWTQFAEGHWLAVFVASAFACFFVFAVAGFLMAILPAKLFARISLLVRFVLAVWLLAVLGSSIAVPEWFAKATPEARHMASLVPPISFLGLAQAVWGSGDKSEIARMAWASVAWTAGAFVIAMIAYALSFRRSFIRIPEMADAGPLPRTSAGLGRLAPNFGGALRLPTQRACYGFAARTILRSGAHLQIFLGMQAVGVVVMACVLASAPSRAAIFSGAIPSLQFLAIPFILSYCAVVGTRMAFELPAELRANWIFRFWLDRDRDEARGVARATLLAFSLPWIAPACFFATLKFWGWRMAALHTVILVACICALVELLLVRFRKIPFTCTTPPFTSSAGLIGVAYVAGFIVFADQMVELERWSLKSPVRILWFALIVALAYLAPRAYRKQQLQMDKDLIFEEAPALQF
jgi:hypothetical protein